MRWTTPCWIWCRSIRSATYATAVESLNRCPPRHAPPQWHLVAAALGTHFTALDCLKRYQQVLRPRAWMRQGGTSIWTAERDRMLVDAVAKHGAGKWQAIAGDLGCAPATAMHRWRAVVKPAMKKETRKGPWKPEEDAKLKAAMALFGQRWSMVAGMVPGRTDTQCRERYCNVLDPTLKCVHGVLK